MDYTTEDEKYMKEALKQAKNGHMRWGGADRLRDRLSG